MNPAEIERVKLLLPTTLGSAEIREQLAADILRRAVFSARMADAYYLSKVRDVCTALADGSISQADARNTLEAVLEQLGHSMQDGGGIKNPISIRRLNLIVDTQTQMAASVNDLLQQTEATVNLWPAWELTRLESRMVPRADWLQRWTAAGTSVGWVGAVRRQMIALKNSPIWQALGDGVGGFTDTLRNPYPPFAFSSGLAWVEVGRDRCEKLGLIRKDEDIDAPDRPTLSPGEADIADAANRYGFDFSDLLK